MIQDRSHLLYGQIVVPVARNEVRRYRRLAAYIAPGRSIQQTDIQLNLHEYDLQRNFETFVQFHFDISLLVRLDQELAEQIVKQLKAYKYVDLQFEEPRFEPIDQQEPLVQYHSVEPELFFEKVILYTGKDHKEATPGDALYDELNYLADACEIAPFADPTAVSITFISGTLPNRVPRTKRKHHKMIRFADLARVNPGIAAWARENHLGQPFGIERWPMEMWDPTNPWVIVTQRYLEKLDQARNA